MNNGGNAIEKTIAPSGWARMMQSALIARNTVARLNWNDFMPNSLPPAQEIGRRSTNCSRLDHHTPDHESKRTTAANREPIGIGKLFTVQSVTRMKNPPQAKPVRETQSCRKPAAGQASVGRGIGGCRRMQRMKCPPLNSELTESYGPTGAAAGRCDFPLAAVQIQENARRTRCGVRGRIRNEHGGRRLAPAVANAWLA